MGTLFASGRIVDLLFAFITLEVLGLAIYRRLTGRGVPFLDLIVSLLAGMALLLALRSALLGSPWPQIAGFLGLSLIAHIADLARRWTAA